jgi:hypothetical protein
MVVNGFSLLELRKLYIDELFNFHQELIYSLEQMGKLKEGSYAKIVSSNKENTAEETVKLLRKQMFKTIADKNKRS